ncbi:DUF2508 domain-containing protein [Paenibacillaceae bacterium WGS1546]|uniref:DUF2508 domain-containing protein n=1 Tax=Cohnella sp. WGS1546 TaxID=3366810 RepID=UPI00372D3D59
MNRRKKDEDQAASAESLERKRLIAEIRKAELEWKQAEWRFHYETGEDRVDHAIYCLEAAEKKLDMLLRQAKLKWNRPSPVHRESEGTG